jgi:hypothetical protein
VSVLRQYAGDAVGHALVTVDKPATRTWPGPAIMISTR